MVTPRWAIPKDRHRLPALKSERRREVDAATRRGGDGDGARARPLRSGAGRRQPAHGSRTF